MTDVGIFASIALIPFVIKILWGMLSDRVNLFGLGHRKPYILIGLAIQFLVLLVIPFVDPGQYYWWFVGLAFILQMGMALYDTCTDGYALDSTPEDEEGTIQGFMVGGRALGVVVTASVVGILADKVSWTAVFWLLAVLTLIPIPMVLRINEGDRPVEQKFEWAAFSAFKQRPVLALSGLGFVFFMIIAGVNVLVNPFLEETFGISLTQAGLYTTVWGVGVVLGGVVGGALMQKVGRRTGTLVSMAISFIGVIALAFTGNAVIAWPIVAAFGLAYGTYQTVYFALSMNFTDERISASMFSILMAISNVAQGAGMALSGFLADSIAFRWTFILFAGLNFLGLPLIGQVFSRKAVE
jgi:PAT family beta-lactamase induction signal transducer AmpG